MAATTPHSFAQRTGRDLVRVAQHHPPVPAIVLEQLAAQAASASERGAAFNEGGIMQLEGGPFVGLVAVFEMPKGNDRAPVLIQMFCKMQQVVVSYNHLTGKQKLISHKDKK